MSKGDGLLPIKSYISLTWSREVTWQVKNVSPLAQKVVAPSFHRVRLIVKVSQLSSHITTWLQPSPHLHVQR